MDLFTLFIADITKSAFSGAATQYVQEQLTEFRSGLDQNLAEEQQHHLLQTELTRIQHEAENWPAKRAVKFIALARGLDSTSGSAGIHNTEQLLTFELLVINRADFVVHVRDLKGTATVFGHEYRVEYPVGEVEERVLAPRDEYTLVIQTTSTSKLPALDQPLNGQRAARLELSLETIVCGPWQDKGQIRVTFSEQIWIPVFSTLVDRDNLDIGDIDLLLADWIERNVKRGGDCMLAKQELEAEAKIPIGTVESSLARIAKKLALTVEGSSKFLKISRARPSNMIIRG